MMHHQQTCHLVLPEPLHSMLQSIYFLFAVPVWPDQSLIHSPGKQFQNVLKQTKIFRSLIFCILFSEWFLVVNCSFKQNCTIILFNWLGQSYCIYPVITLWKINTLWESGYATYIKFAFASGKIEEQVQF